MLGEYVHEAAQTRKVLERIPTDKAIFAPQEKSMTLAQQALPRGQCVRSMCFNHTVHHRGQLRV